MPEIRDIYNTEIRDIYNTPNRVFDSGTVNTLSRLQMALIALLESAARLYNIPAHRLDAWPLKLPIVERTPVDIVWEYMRRTHPRPVPRLDPPYIERVLCTLTRATLLQIKLQPQTRFYEDLYTFTLSPVGRDIALRDPASGPKLLAALGARPRYSAPPQPSAVDYREYAREMHRRMFTPGSVYREPTPASQSTFDEVHISPISPIDPITGR